MYKDNEHEGIDIFSKSQILTVGFPCYLKGNWVHVYSNCNTCKHTYTLYMSYSTSTCTPTNTEHN